MTSRPPTLVRSIFACCLLACVTSAVLSCSAAQDLGRDDPSGNEPVAPGSHLELEHGSGFGAAWAFPDSPLARDLACPLTAPIDGAACSSRAIAPCVYPADEHEGSALCLCTKQLRWTCLAQVAFRGLEVPLMPDAACLEGSAPEVTRRCIGDECTACGGPCEVTCRCSHGAYVCGGGS